MEWGNIDAVQKSWTVRALGFWFVFIPLLAVLLKSRHMPQIVQDISLPFTWGLFYVASMLFFCATILYRLRCPRLIKNFSTFSEFEAQGCDYESLRPLLCEIANRTSAATLANFLERVANHVWFRDFGPQEWLARAGGNNDNAWLKSVLANSRVDHKRDNNLPSLFGLARHIAQDVEPVTRFSISALHVVGFCLLAIVIIQNAFSVGRYYFS